MKKVVLLGLFVFLATSVWSQDLKAIVYRAFMYLGSPVPEAAAIEGNIGRIVDNEYGDYKESWAFELDANKKVKSAHYYIYDSNRNNLSRILSDIDLQIIINGYKFFQADGQMKVYVTNDGPFSIVIAIANSVMTAPDGKTWLQISFARLSDMIRK